MNLPSDLNRKLGTKLHLGYATAFAIAVILGESYRSWGAGRPIPAWLDDFIGCGILLVAVGLILRFGRQFWPWLTAGWGIMFGLTYGSFFSKYYSQEPTDAGNISFNTLLILVGLGFAASTIGLLWSLFFINSNKTSL